MITRAKDRPTGLTPGPALRLERRSKPRVEVSFAAMVQGNDSEGRPFEMVTTLDNLSHSGLYLKIPEPVSEGSRLLITVLMDGQSGEPQERNGMTLEVYGLIKRVEPARGGMYGVAVSFNSSVLL